MSQYNIKMILLENSWRQGLTVDWPEKSNSVINIYIYMWQLTVYLFICNLKFKEAYNMGLK